MSIAHAVPFELTLGWVPDVADLNGQSGRVGYAGSIDVELGR